MRAGTECRVFRLIPVAALMWLLLACLGSVSAEELPLLASPNPAAVYQKVTLSIIVPARNPEAVSAEYRGLAGAVHLISGPYIQPYIDERNPGVSEVRVSYVIEGNEPGRIVIPSFAITVDGSRRMTKPTVMTFGVLRGGQIVVPLEPVWRLPSEGSGATFFAGEAIPVVLELRNEPVPEKIDEVRLSGTPAGLEKVPPFSEAVGRQIGDATLYQVPAAAYILTPTASGTVTLPTASVKAGGRTGVSAPAEINVDAAPEAIATTGAIGALSFRSWMTSRRVRGGEEIFLHLRVEGTGNLPSIALPRPTTSGLLELGNDETQSIDAGASGYRGFRERIYRFLRPASISPGVSGPVISVPAFPWLDPATHDVESVPEATYRVSLPAAGSSSAQTPSPPAGSASAAPVGATGTAAVEVPFAPESAATVRSSEYREFYSRGESYLWLLPGPLVFGMFLLVRPRGRGRAGGLGAAALFLLLSSCHPAVIHDRVAAGVTAYQKGRMGQAEKDFVAARSSYPRNAALSFDLALVQYRLGRYGAAIHLVRNAIFYDPLSAKYRAALDWMVNQIGVAEQVPPAYPIHPDLFLMLLIAAVNVASILGILVTLRGRGGLAIALILCLVLALIAAGGLAYSAAKRSVETAVVKSSGTEMTKIPMAAAGRWLELPAGMAVRVLDSTDGYYLVQTAYGNTGWVRQNRMLLDHR